MTPGLGVAIMMNNYLHDVATALLAASAVALWGMLREYRRAASVEAGRYFLAIHGRMAKLARVSLAWIVVGGIPRTVFYRDFEWANAAGRLQVPALVAKHVLAFGLVVAGIWLWRRLGAQVREVRALVNAAAGAPARGAAGTPR